MIKWVIFDAMGVVLTVDDDTNDPPVPFAREPANGSFAAEAEVKRSAELGNAVKCICQQ